MTFCKHVYENMNEELCSLCGQPTHEVNWEDEAKLMREWKEANPKAAYGGWWSI
jgi:hypothetical protein